MTFDDKADLVEMVTAYNEATMETTALYMNITLFAAGFGVIACILILALSLKLYTEIMKEKSMRGRATGGE
jgi:hypothetical protein